MHVVIPAKARPSLSSPPWTKQENSIFQTLADTSPFLYGRGSRDDSRWRFFMSVVLLTIAFASVSSFQPGGADMGSGADLRSERRDIPQSDASEGVDVNGERRICRRIVVSGSHRYRRVCMTAEEWRRHSD